MTGETLVRSIEIAYTLQSVMGILVALYAAGDTWLDLRAAVSDPSADWSEVSQHLLQRLDHLTADIGISAAVGALILHGIFLFLGMVGLTSPVAPAAAHQIFHLDLHGLLSAATTSIVRVGACVTVAQLAAIAVQIRVLLRRHQLRVLWLEITAMSERRTPPT